MAIAGRVAIVPKGDWSANATYKRLDAVTYNNTLYFAKKEVPAGTATSNTEYWSKSIVGGASAIATTEDAGVVKPDGKSMSVDESGTLSINLDGTTITLDEAKNVIKLADTLKDAINGAFPAANVANNQITTVEGFALDARQANPNIDGTLAKQISDLNGSLKTKISNPICDRVNILKKITYSNINNWTPVIEYTTKSECILLVDGTVKISTNVPYDGVSGLDVFIQDMWTHLVADKTGTVILPIHWNGLMPLNGKFIVYLGLGEQYTYIINEDSSSDARAFCCNFTELPLGK